MGLEVLTGTKYISDLDANNPTIADPKSQGDDHLRGIKNVLQKTFAAITGAVTLTHAQLNRAAAITVTGQENFTVNPQVSGKGIARPYVGSITAAGTITYNGSGGNAWTAAFSGSPNFIHTITHNIGHKRYAAVIQALTGTGPSNVPYLSGMTKNNNDCAFQFWRINNPNVPVAIELDFLIWAFD